MFLLNFLILVEIVVIVYYHYFKKKSVFLSLDSDALEGKKYAQLTCISSAEPVSGYMRHLINV